MIVLLASIASNSNAHDFWRLDKTLPLSKSTDGTNASKYAPVFDFDTDGCLPSSGISSWGEQNGGLKPSGSITGKCRRSDFLNYSNTYHRYVCKNHNNKSYCAHVYSLYFLKDQATIAGGGHRHDWENVVVWTIGGNPTHVSVSAHGKLSTNTWSNTPKLQEHPKVVYHKDGLLTHAFRFAKKDENWAENPYHDWLTPTIVSWYTMKGSISNSDMIYKFSRFDYGSANLPIQYENMLNKLNTYKPMDYPEYNYSDLSNSK